MSEDLKKSLMSGDQNEDEVQGYGESPEEVISTTEHLLPKNDLSINDEQQVPTDAPLIDPNAKTETHTKTPMTCVALVILFTLVLLCFCCAVAVALTYVFIKRIVPIKPVLFTNIIETECGPVKGIDEKDTKGYYSYLGIPYSVERSGETRWKPPVGLKQADQCWEGVFEADSYSDICVQNDPYDPKKATGSEDCLYLNVFAPEVENIALPVVLWIHGGGLTSGSSNMWYKTPEIFAAENEAVVVTMNYRLGIHGFLSLEELDRADPRGVSGNYALLDILEVLKWINRNIANFGGDSELVTIMGQSAGATLGLVLMTMSSAQPYFEKVIAMSPPMTLFFKPAERARADFFSVIQRSSCQGKMGKDLTDCLYVLSNDEIVSIPMFDFMPPWMFGIPPEAHDVFNWLTVDGKTVTQTIVDAVEQDDFDYTDLLIGWMREENDINPMIILFNNQSLPSHLWEPWTEEQYQAIITQIFYPYALETNDPLLVQQVLQMYPYAKFDTPQQAFDQISTDILFACGALSIARKASKYHRDVYVYEGVQVPTSPRILNPQMYSSRYAFHMYDSMCVFNNTDWFQLDEGEVKFGDFMRSSFYDFFRSNIPYFDSTVWKDFAKSEGVAVVTTQGGGSHREEFLKRSVCQFWEGKNLFEWPV